MDLGDTSRMLEKRLSPEHLDMLRVESGISDEVILVRGYRTIRDPSELEKLGFIKVQRRVPGLLLPLHTTDGNVGSYVYRPDHPRRVGRKRPDGTKKLAKYEHLRGVGVRLDCPPICQAKLADPSIPLWITEGQKKADALASHGLCAVALMGVWGFKDKNTMGGTTLLADWDYVALNNREVRVVFDSEVMIKTPVRSALARLTEHLQRKRDGSFSGPLVAMFLPTGPNDRTHHRDLRRLTSAELMRELGQARFLWLWVGDTEPWIGQRLDRLQHERKRRKGQAP